MADAISDEPRTLTSLPAELLMLVAEDLDVRCLARFAAACKVCLAAAEDELHAALLAVVEHCLVPGSRLISNALAACPYLFCLSSAVVFPAGTFVDSASIIKLTLPASLTTIGIGALAGCCHLAELTLPATLETIGDGAFAGCTALYAHTGLEPQASIDHQACVLLTRLSLAFDALDSAQLILPAGLTTIGCGAFRNCRSLTSIALPTSLTSLGDYAFVRRHV